MATAIALCLSSCVWAGNVAPAAVGTELDKARAAKKQAGEEKARAYLEAHLLYKKCEREYRPFCMLSAQTIMRTADARYKYRERQEFPDIAAMEAAASSPRIATQ